LKFNNSANPTVLGPFPRHFPHELLQFGLQSSSFPFEFLGLRSHEVDVLVFGGDHCPHPLEPLVEVFPEHHQLEDQLGYRL